MEGTKKWYQSLGIWGSALVMILGVILPIFGKADMATFVQEESAGIVEWLTALGTLIGGALAFYGRYRAKTEIE